jgi:hypothetical protein
VLGVAAALAPSADAAEAPVPLPDATAIVDATLQATAPAAPPDVEPVLEAVEELADTASVPVAAVATPPAAPAQAAPAPAEKPAAPAVQTAAPAPETAQKAAVPAPDAPVESAEARREPAEPAATQVADAVVSQGRPVNLNISIRVESPGDNGPVSQINAAVGAVAAELAAAPTAGAQASPAAQEPRGSETQVEAPPPDPAGEAAETPIAVSAGPAEQWDWTWQWDCGEVISPDIALPGTSSLPIWNWNWNWNCGADPPVSGKSESEIPSQYHGGTTQYQPINVNISIRVSSPGNDGAVSQANVAQTIVSVIAAAAQPVLALRPAPGASAHAAPSSSQTQATEARRAESLAELIVELSADMAALPLELVVDLDCCAVPASFAEVAGGDDASRGLVEEAPAGAAPTGAPFRAAPRPERRDITAAAAAIAQLAPVAPPEVAALVVPKPKAEAARRAATHERLTGHVKHRAAPAAERVAELSYGGITPLGAPDRTPKVLLLFLLPFVFAFAAAARRVEDEDRVAAAEPGRPEGRPG